MGADLLTFDNPETEDVVEELPWKYDLRLVNVESTVTRSIGTDVKHRLSLGHRLEVQRPSLTADFPMDPIGRDAFERYVFPRSERSSALVARYSLFTPVYTVYRDVDSFDLPEDQRLGPELLAELGAAFKAIGSEANFLTPRLGGAWTLDIADDGVVRFSAGVRGRLQSGRWTDNVVSGTVAGASPPGGGSVPGCCTAYRSPSISRHGKPVLHRRWRHGAARLHHRCVSWSGPCPGQPGAALDAHAYPVQPCWGARLLRRWPCLGPL